MCHVHDLASFKNAEVDCHCSSVKSRRQKWSLDTARMRGMQLHRSQIVSFQLHVFSMSHPQMKNGCLHCLLLIVNFPSSFSEPKIAIEFFLDSLWYQWSSSRNFEAATDCQNGVDDQLWGMRHDARHNHEPHRHSKDCNCKMLRLTKVLGTAPRVSPQIRWQSRHHRDLGHTYNMYITFGLSIAMFDCQGLMPSENLPAATVELLIAQSWVWAHRAMAKKKDHPRFHARRITMQTL